jgi:hypothetical protein
MFHDMFHTFKMAGVQVLLHDIHCLYSDLHITEQNLHKYATNAMEKRLS